MAERAWNLDDGFTLVTAEEISYLSGVTSAIQTQINGKLANVVEDTTPQLGGDLDLNGNTFSISGGTGLDGQAVVSDGAGGVAWEYAGGTVQPTDARTYNIRAANQGATAGNARGENSVDLQTDRSVNTQVASGAHSVVLGGEDNTAQNNHAIAGGQTCVASGVNAVAIGVSCTSSGLAATALGSGNTAAGPQSFIACQGNSTASGNGYCVVFGQNNHISGTGDYGGILSGQSHDITTGGNWSVIAGGYGHQLTGGSAYNGILSGNANQITLPHVNSGAGANVICGGRSNLIDDNTLGTTYSIIGGGYLHTIGGDYNGVLSGYDNEIVENATY